jgi:hypothetical protein
MTARGPEMRRISQSLSTALRTERIILRHQLSVLVGRSIAFALAGLFAVVAVVMLNLAGFFWLAEGMTAGMAAFLVALADLALAAILVLVAVLRNADGRIEPAVELRAMALADLREDTDRIADDASELARDLRRLARDPLGSLLPGVIGPLLSLLISLRKK